MRNLRHIKFLCKLTSCIILTGLISIQPMDLLKASVVTDNGDIYENVNIFSDSNTGLILTVQAMVTSPQSPDDRGKTQEELNGYSEEQWAKLMDNKLEYDEISDLVKNFNPSISSAWESFDSNVDNMTDMVENLQSRKREAKDYKDASKESMDIAGITNGTMQEMILDAAVSSMSKARDMLARPVTDSNRQLRVAQDQVTSAVQSVMIAYDGVRSQETTLNTMVVMYSELFDAAQAQAALGLATQTDVNTAYGNLLSAQANLSKLQAGKESLRRNLIVMCGWNENDNPEIGTIPEPDISHIDSMNPDVDITKAIGNNYSLVTYRRGDHSISSVALDVRSDMQTQMESNLKTNLEADYQAVISTKTALDAAKLSYEAAQNSKNAADTQYNIGMLSKAQYTGTKLSFLSAQAAYESASRNLFQAMNTYDWDVAGNCSID